MSFRPSFTDLPAFLKLPPGSFTAVQQLAPLTDRAWSWWTGELLSMIPARLRKTILELMPKTYLLELEDSEIVTRELRSGPRSSSRPSVERRSISWTQAVETLPKRTRVIIVLPANAALIADASLPPASATALRAAASLQLERHVPFRAEDVYYDVHRRAAEVDNTTSSKIAVLPRRKLDPIVDAARQHDLHVARIQLRLEDGRLDDRFNFGWSMRGFTRTWPAREQIAAGVLALTMSVIAISMVERRWENERSTLEAAISSLASDATLARRLDQEIAAAATRIAVIRQVDNALATLNLLEDLAERLPDGAWLETLSFRPEQIVLAGFGEDTATVASALEASDHLLSVGLKDLAAAPNGAHERFEIQAVPSVKP